ncbi:hypothetical protein GEMRC1_003973 [Eukaryota sp. GEM-RC1]
MNTLIEALSSRVQQYSSVDKENAHYLDVLRSVITNLRSTNANLEDKLSKQSFQIHELTSQLHTFHSIDSYPTVTQATSTIDSSDELQHQLLLVTQQLKEAEARAQEAESQLSHPPSPLFLFIY